MAYLDNVLSGALEISVDGVDLSRRKRLALNSGENVQLEYAEGAEAVSVVVTSAGGNSAVAALAPVDIVLTSNDSLSGVTARDGITPVAGTTRILVAGQTDTAQNGVYVASSSMWSRATDADADADFVVGQQVAVKSGTLGAGSRWELASGTTIAGAKAYRPLTDASDKDYVDRVNASLMVQPKPSTRAANRTALTSMVAAAKASGGRRIVFPAGVTHDFDLDSAFDLTYAPAVIFEGGGGAPISGTRLVFHGRSAPRIFDCRSSGGIVFKDLSIVVTDPHYLGPVIDLDWVTSSPAARAIIRNCSFYQAAFNTAPLLTQTGTSPTITITGSTTHALRLVVEITSATKFRYSVSGGGGITPSNGDGDGNWVAENIDIPAGGTYALAETATGLTLHFPAGTYVDDTVVTGGLGVSRWINAAGNAYGVRVEDCNFDGGYDAIYMAGAGNVVHNCVSKAIGRYCVFIGGGEIECDMITEPGGDGHKGRGGIFGYAIQAGKIRVKTGDQIESGSWVVLNNCFATEVDGTFGIADVNSASVTCYNGCNGITVRGNHVYAGYILNLPNRGSTNIHIRIAGAMSSRTASNCYSGTNVGKIDIELPWSSYHVDFGLGGTNPVYGGLHFQANGYVQGLRVLGYSAILDKGAQLEIDWSRGPEQKATLDTNSTYTFLPPVGVARGLSLSIYPHATNTYTCTLPLILWKDQGAPPPLTPGGFPLRIDLDYDGTNYHGRWSVTGSGAKYRGALAGNELTGIKYATFSGWQDHGDTGAAENFSLIVGAAHRATLTDNCTITLTPPSSGIGGILIELTQDATGGRTVTWPTAYWVGATTAQQPDPTADTTSVFQGLWDGTNWTLTYLGRKTLV